ncbi:MAG TPA: hypothetical protein VGL29_22485 [Blastocatellia bacterium]|jgi:hypothetical protein
MKRALLVIIVAALFVLHQDFWFWRSAHPLVFGFIPVGLFYHACYTVVVAIVLWVLVSHAWPSELEEGGGADFSLRDSNELDHRLKSAPRGQEGDCR